MALLRSIIGELSGSVAGITFAHNKGGQYTRQRKVPVNRNSVRQQVVRAALSTNARAWAGLTVAQRAAWAAYAALNPVINRLGESITLSGNAAYNMLNGVLADAGSTLIAAPPSGAGPASLSTCTVVTTSSTNVAITFTATPLPAGAKLQVWWSGPGKASQDPNFAQARLVGYSTAAVASPAAIALPAAFTTGLVSNFWVRVMDGTGRLSPALKVRVTSNQP